MAIRWLIKFGVVLALFACFVGQGAAQSGDAGDEAIELLRDIRSVQRKRPGPSARVRASRPAAHRLCLSLTRPARRFSRQPMPLLRVVEKRLDSESCCLRTMCAATARVCASLS